MKISGVAENSVGVELGIERGDELVSIDGRRVTDILDYEYCESLNFFKIVIKRDNKEFEIEVEKDDDETLGLEFSDELTVRQCCNKCIFCFVDQLPKKDLRKTLKIKDDDYRHSFLTGTYVTLTNLSESDIKRIIRLKLSPLYVSVHSTDDIVRNKLLGLKKAFSITPLLKRFKDNGIGFHSQIVYCPGFNEDLESTITDLMPLSLSLSIVPVGLTKDANPDLRPIDKENSKRVIGIVERIQSLALRTVGTRFVWAADEFYVKAGADFPPAEEYEAFSQIENGVGLCARFIQDFDFALNETKIADFGHISIATGESAYPLISALAQRLTNKFGGQIDVHKIKNDFFGHTVTVAGLITGGDIYSQLQNVIRTGTLLIPSVMLKENNDLFLDGMSVKNLEQLLNVKIIITASDGESIVKTISNLQI